MPPRKIASITVAKIKKVLSMASSFRLNHDSERCHDPLNGFCQLTSALRDRCGWPLHSRKSHPRVALRTPCRSPVHRCKDPHENGFRRSSTNDRMQLPAMISLHQPETPHKLVNMIDSSYAGQYDSSGDPASVIGELPAHGSAGRRDPVDSGLPSPPPPAKE